MTFADAMRADLPKGLEMPQAFERLFAWMDAHGTVVDGCVGHLAPPAVLEQREEVLDEDGEYVMDRRQGGTGVFFATGLNDGIHHWFGWNPENEEDRAAAAHLHVIAKTGYEGSMAALWLDDEGCQRIVHMGSGSGSTLVSVLVDSPEDFIRLCAVGYGELCWESLFSQTPEETFGEWECAVVPYAPFIRFVSEELGLSVPERGDEVVVSKTQMDDDVPSGDPFHEWMRAVAR